VRTFCAQICVEVALVTTRGEAIEKWATRAEVLELLGSIVTPDDALMLAAASGYTIACPPKNVPNYPEGALPSVARTERGFEVVGTRSQNTCPVVLERVRMLIEPSGEITELEHKSSTWAVCA